MKFLLILWLAGGTPTSIEFDSATACTEAGKSLNLFANPGAPGPWRMFCLPKGGSGKAYSSSLDAVAPFNRF